MRHRRLLGMLAVGIVLTTVLALLGIDDVASTDYRAEAQPAYDALIAGDISGFFARLPGYGGTLVLHAPVAWAVGALGGGAQAVFVACCLPALVALLALGVALAMRVPGRGGWVVLVLVTVNPLAYQALDYGHPEELLVGVLCVAAVLAGQRGRAVLAGLLLGVAIAAKPWAVLAVGPVLLALPRCQLKTLLVAGAAASVILAPVVLLGGAATRVAPHTGAVFHPWQIWWFLGAAGDPWTGIEGYRNAPAWIVSLTHPLIVGLGLVLSAAWWRRDRDRADAIGLLALILLVRCVLDPWNNPYYELPFVLALVTWESTRGARMPVLGILMTLLAWVTFVTLPKYVMPDTYAAVYLAWALPAVALLGLRVYAPDWARARAPAVWRLVPDGDTTVTLRPSVSSAGR